MPNGGSAVAGAGNQAAPRAAAAAGKKPAAAERPSPKAIVFNHDGQEIEVKHPSDYGLTHIEALDKYQSNPLNPPLKFETFNADIKKASKSLVDISADSTEQEQLAALATLIQSNPASAESCTVSA